MSPYELVGSKYTLPFDLYPFQQDAVNELACRTRSGLYFEPGLGKTATSTVCALYSKIEGSEMTLVLVPPIVIPRWQRWLSRVCTREGSALRVLRYQGTPLQRKEMTFEGQDFVLMSMQVFQKDYARICSDLGPKRVHIILDEAQCIKNIKTKNFRMFRDFVSGFDVSLDSQFFDIDLRMLCLEPKSYQLLTGTPLNSPEDSYAYVKLVSPNVYRNMAQWEIIHIAQRDCFGKPIRYGNLDLLCENLILNSVRKTKDEVLVDLPEFIIMPIDYDLAPRHMKLYRKLVEEQLLKFPDGEDIDATQATALYHALGQIIMQWGHYGGDMSLKSTFLGEHSVGVVWVMIAVFRQQSTNPSE